MKQTSKSLIEWGKQIDISSEIYREYIFPDKEIVHIACPKYLIVSDNGHRVCDMDNVSHYIPYGWIHLMWENKDKEQFQFNHQREKNI